MRKGLSTLVVLLSLGPTLAVPVTLWHHHGAETATSVSEHHCGSASHETPAPSHEDENAAEQCPVCVFSKLVHIELPAVTTIVVEIRPTLPQNSPAAVPVALSLPLSLDARGPPATAPVA